MSAATETTLPFRTRRDVLATAVLRDADGTRVVQDPLALEHFELTAEQWFVASALASQQSLRKLQKAVEQEFAPRRVQPAELWQLIGELHKLGLVVATNPGQADSFAERDQEQRTARRRWGWMELLAWRLPGFRPQRLVDACYSVVRPILSLPGLLLCAVLVLAALGLLVSQFDRFIAVLPTMQLVQSSQFWITLVLVACVVKAFHELGHAVVARHHGCEVSEMGILLLCGMPTLYTDVSSSWQLSNRAKRMSIVAAGIGVEIVLAAIALFVWWMTHPGIIQTIALCVVMFASIGTLLVNGNPLLRYDGYYLLSDATHASNLWQRSRLAMRQWITGSFWRQPLDVAPKRESAWLAVYGVLSQCYVYALLATIGLAVWRFALPRDYDLLAFAAIGLLLAVNIAQPMRSAAQLAANPAARQRLRWGRATVAILFVLSLGWGLLAWPIRYRVDALAMTQFANSRDVVVTQPGRIDWTIESGTSVTAETVISQLSNPELDLQYISAQSDVELAATQVDQFEKLLVHDNKVSRELPAARARLAAARQQLSLLEQERDRLAIKSPIAGVVTKPADRTEEVDELTLTSWNGQPLDEANRGAWLDAGTVVAIVAPSRELEVRLGIAERDTSRVAIGQSVRVQLSGLPNRILTGEISQLAEMRSTSDEAHRQWRTSPYDTLAEQIRYEAVVVLDEPMERLPAGTRGRAKIEVGHTNLGALLNRWFDRLVAID